MHRPRQRVVLLGVATLAVLACLAVASAVTGGAAAASPAAAAAKPAADWQMNATAIEACSCPMFCQCYFNSAPAEHHDHGAKGETHYCRANLAYRINRGHYGPTDLSGAKFWLVNDLGADFSKGQMDWNILYFDKTLSPAQRAGITAIT